MRGSFRPGNAPDLTSASLWHTPQASTFTRTWRIAGVGISRSTTSKGPFAFETWTARILAMVCPPLTVTVARSSMGPVAARSNQQRNGRGRCLPEPLPHVGRLVDEMEAAPQQRPRALPPVERHAQRLACERPLEDEVVLVGLRVAEPLHRRAGLGQVRRGVDEMLLRERQRP